MKYTRIIFAGVDLNNCKYFWLPPNKTRKQFSSHKAIHPIYGSTMFIVKAIKKYFNLNMFSISKKSFLNNIVPYVDLDKL